MDKWLIKIPTNKSATPSQPSCSASNPTSSKTKKRKYDESYLQYGFTCSSHNNEEQPVCLICKEVLAAESMKPSKLQRHLNTKHATLSKKPIEYFERLLQTSIKEKNTLEKYVTLNDKYLLASYEVSYLIAKTKKPFTIGEQLLLPAAIRMSEIVHGKQYAAEISKIPLSNDTVSKRISDISNDQFQQLLMRLKDSSKFAIQLDESTDISKMAQLLLFVRYIYEGSIHEDILFCRPLEGHTRGKDIYKKVNEFFEKEGLNWKNCVGVCTDGAAAMTGQDLGFTAFVKAGNDHITFTHCMIHREALVVKKIAPELNTVFFDAVKIINFIKSRALNSRLFKNLCIDMDSDYTSLLLHAEVRWLSRGRSLKRLLTLKDEVLIFLTEQNSNLADYFYDNLWLLKLCYLADIFDKINDMNLSMQGVCVNMFMLKNKLEAFVKKILIWKNRVESGSLEMFPFTDEYIISNNISKKDTPITKIIVNHLKDMEVHMHRYFPNDIDTQQWICNPFSIEMEEINFLNLKAQEEFAELTSDTTLRLRFSQVPVHEFWIEIKSEYPLLSEMAMNKLLPFCTTYLCESAFSTLTYIKSKYRSTLINVENLLRSAITQIEPRFNYLCKNKQSHPSH